MYIKKICVISIMQTCLQTRFGRNGRGVGKWRGHISDLSVQKIPKTLNDQFKMLKNVLQTYQRNENIQLENHLILYIYREREIIDNLWK